MTVEAKMVEMSPRDVGYMGTAAGSVWVATSEGLVRIDPDDMSVDTVDPAPGGFGMFATESSVWASNFDLGTVTRFDAATGSPTVVAKLNGNPNALSVLDDAVWVGQHRGGAVTRLDARSGAVVLEVKAGRGGRSGPQGVTATPDAVWVGIPNIKGVVRIDPETNKVVATIPTKTSPCGGIAATADAVWVSSCFDDKVVVRIDPRTNEVIGEFPIGGYNGGAILVDGYPWFPVGGRLVRLDPATNKADGVVQFADTFEGFGTAVGFGSVWVGDAPGGQVARIPLSVLENWVTP
ncbi:MAG: hypothetical protein ACJ77F_05585 [Chloroflexota bacterium]